MAMLPFCGYNMGDYFSHWLSMRERLTNPPKVFMVNWFRKDGEGRFVWPGYGENIRVLKWIMERVEGRGAAERSPVGMKPSNGALDLAGLEVAPDSLREAMAVKPQEWAAELESQAEFFNKLGSSVPPMMEEQRRTLRSALNL
jgi:phosphoenolpyruvate carboxykinase (GTP)